MIKDMYSVMGRINEIRKRFGLIKPNRVNSGRSFQREMANRLQEAEKSVNSVEKVNDVKNGKLSIPEIKKIVNRYSRIYGISESLINALIKTESGYNQFAVSKKGAKGLMQLMPGIIRETGVSNPFVPEENIRGGVSLLRRLLEKYNWDYKKALSAYNAGENAVANKGVPPYNETKVYIQRVVDAYMKNSK